LTLREGPYLLYPGREKRNGPLHPLKREFIRAIATKGGSALRYEGEDPSLKRDAAGFSWDKREREAHRHPRPSGGKGEKGRMGKNKDQTSS